MRNEKTSNFNEWVHSFGITSSLVLLVAMTAFPVSVSAIYGVWPDLWELWPAIVAVILFMAPWWPGETIGYMSIMGPGALYMSYITGNVTNLKMPATVGTINSLGIEPNTEQCHTMAIIVCGASIMTSIVIIAAGVIIAVPARPILEAEILQPAFNYVIPALFGGLVAQTVLKGTRKFLLFLVPLGVCLFFSYFTAMSSAYYMLIGIAVSLAVYLWDYTRTVSMPRQKPKREEV